MRVLEECTVKRIEFENLQEFESYFDNLQDSGVPFRRISESYYSHGNEKMEAEVVFTDNDNSQFLKQLRVRLGE